MTRKHLAPPTTFDDLIQRLQAEFSSLPPQFQVAVRYLLDHPAEVPVVSMRTVASQAGVQPATLVRLAQSLGYSGWAGLKTVFVHSLPQTVVKGYAEQAQRVVRNKRSPNKQQKMLDAQMLNIQALENLNTEKLPAITDIIHKAKRVYVAGFRASYPPAFGFHYLYRLFRSSVYMLRSDAGTLEMELRSLGPSDVVLLIGFAPYSQEIVRVYEAAKAAGSQIIAMCDSPVAPIALEANGLLLFNTETSSFFPSITAASALVELLAEQLLARTGMRAVNDIAKAEQQLHHTGAYWTKH